MIINEDAAWNELGCQGLCELYVWIFACVVCVGACGSSLSGAGVGKWVGSCHLYIQLLSLVAILNWLRVTVGWYLCLGSRKWFPQEKPSYSIERDAGGGNGVRYLLSSFVAGCIVAIRCKILTSFCHLQSCFKWGMGGVNVLFTEVKDIYRRFIIYAIIFSVLTLLTLT